jgi:hypothetical protein
VDGTELGLAAPAGAFGTNEEETDGLAASAVDGCRALPAFFLAGFGIVAALAGGSEGDSGPEAAQPSTPGGPGTDVDTVAGETDAAETPTAAGSPTTGGAGGGDSGATVTARGDGDGGSGGGGGGVPPAPPPGVIKIEYGRWGGIFELESPEILPDFGQATVVGALRYAGGMDCPVGLVRVKAWLFGDGALHVGTTVWESTQSTGDGAEVTGREPVVFEAVSRIDQAAVSAVLRFTAVDCL